MIAIDATIAVQNKWGSKANSSQRRLFYTRFLFIQFVTQRETLKLKRGVTIKMSTLFKRSCSKFSSKRTATPIKVAVAINCFAYYSSFKS